MRARARPLPGARIRPLHRAVARPFVALLRFQRATRIATKILKCFSGYRSMIRFYRLLMFIICPLDKPYKGFCLCKSFPAVAGCGALGTHRTYIPCHMVRNDNFFYI